MSGRLYRAAGATGAQAQDALPALGEEHQAPRLDPDAPTPAAAPAQAAGSGRPDRGLTWTQAAIVLTTVAVLAAGASALATRGLGVWTGGPFLIAVVLTALATRFEDRWAAAVMAPIAWLVAVLGPGQLLVTHDGPVWLTQALLVFQGMSDNALWLTSSVLAAVTLAVARGRRGS